MDNITVIPKFTGNAAMEKKFNMHVRHVERALAIYEDKSKKATVTVIGSGNAETIDVYITVESPDNYFESVLVRNLENFSGNFV